MEAALDYGTTFVPSISIQYIYYRSTLYTMVYHGDGVPMHW
jgi:hypothetical protein